MNAIATTLITLNARFITVYLLFRAMLRVSKHARHRLSLMLINHLSL
jgi:hypothetical protein